MTWIELTGKGGLPVYLKQDKIDAIAALELFGLQSDIYLAGGRIIPVKEKATVIERIIRTGLFLEDCPECGGEPETFNSGGRSRDNPPMKCIRCSKCGSKSQDEHTVDSAIEVWNRRSRRIQQESDERR